MAFTLVCNYKNCLKEIVTTGWATTCSHIFCENHGYNIKRNWKAIKCPACGKAFSGSYCIIETKVNPSPDYKLVALIGLKPVDILEIASNAIYFWVHQLNQEIIVLRKKNEYYKEKLLHARDALERNKKSYEGKLEKLTRMLEEAECKIKDLNLEIIEKSRRISSLTDRKEKQKLRHSSRFEDSLLD